MDEINDQLTILDVLDKQATANPNIARSLIIDHQDDILKFANQRIPSDNTINRDFIKSIIESVDQNQEPFIPGRRLLTKIRKHIEYPYSDEEFKRGLELRRQQAEEIANRVFKEFPNNIIAIGLTGSLARENGFGFNPHKSDIDLLVYYGKDPQDDTGGSIDLSSGITKITKEYSEKYNVEIESGADTTLPFGGGQLSGWVMTTPEGIAKHIQKTPKDMFFKLMLQVASNHVNGKFIVSNSTYKVDFEIMSKSLEAFYQEWAVENIEWFH